jgi:hypothetical protein
MKNAIKVLCFVLAVIVVVGASGLVYFKWDNGDFKYTAGSESGTVVITEYTGNSVNIVIPNRLRGKKVVSIDESAFSGMDIVSLKISKYVTSIGKNAFEGCTQLESVDLGTSVKTIGDMAFANCTSLKSVKMSAELRKIGSPLFGNDSALENVDFTGNKNFVCENGVIYSTDKTVLYEALSYANLSSYQCPQTVTEIKQYALYNHSELTSFTFPSGLNKIPDGLFTKCTGLTELVVPSTVTQIGVSVLDSSGVKTITIPSSVTTIDANAFYGMEKQLTIVTVKNSKAETFANDKGFTVKIVDSL